MPSNDIAITVRNLTKTYRLFSHPGDRIKQFLSFGMRRYHREFTALKDVSFEIKKGETVGIIGRNGSGKSTLLQLICGILKPTSGSVQVNGRISALLELGAGFNPEFTGRENVYFQGALMGFTQAQMETRFDDIAAFADIGEFIDQPVRTYSSGMFVRLAFAAAIHVEPDILVVDEALGVGDQAFQAKCLEHIDTLRKLGGTIIFVSHSHEQIAHHCHNAYLLEQGQLIAGGDTASTLAIYLHNLSHPVSEVPVPALSPVVSRGDIPTDDFHAHPLYWHGETRWGDGKARILFVQIRQNGNIDPTHLLVGQPIEIVIDVMFEATICLPIFGLTFKTERGATLFTTNSRELAGPAHDFATGERGRITFGLTPWLESGRYFLSLGVASETSQGLIPHDRRYDSLAVSFLMPRTESGAPEMCSSFTLEVLK